VVSKEPCQTMAAMRPARARHAACGSRLGADEEESLLQVESERLCHDAGPRGREVHARSAPGSGRGGGAATLAARGALVLVAAGFLLSAWIPSRWGRDRQAEESHGASAGRVGTGDVVGAHELLASAEGPKVFALAAAPPDAAPTLDEAGSTTTTFTVTLTTETRTLTTRTSKTWTSRTWTSRTATLTTRTSRTWTSRTWTSSTTTTTTTKPKTWTTSTTKPKTWADTTNPKTWANTSRTTVRTSDPVRTLAVGGATTTTLLGTGTSGTSTTLTETTRTETTVTSTSVTTTSITQTGSTEETTRTEATATGTDALTTSTTATVFFDKLPPPDFPEIMYLTVPESEEDTRRLTRMKREVATYLPQNRWGVRIIPGVVPDLWPEGRYDRVFKYGQMLPLKRFSNSSGAPGGSSGCSWTYKDQGGLYNHFYDAAPGANTLDACKEHCCHDPKCKAIRFSPSAVDGQDLQCLLYPRGLVAWSLERPLYEDYRVYLLDEGSEGPEGSEDDELPWWDLRNLNMARVTSEGTHPKDQRAWPAHHCGCSLSHFTMWMEALQRGVQNLIIFESDGFPSCIESFRIGGNVSDFADIVAALPSRAPEGWHLIALDKGDFGAEPGATPVTTLRPASGGGTRSYSMIPWKGRGVAGAAAYMVSRRFLEWFPHDIQNYGFNMVDAWIGCRCSDKSAVNPSPINCYSIVAEGHKSE